MHKKVRIAFFDFCDTCVNFQTANSYVEYVLNAYRLRRLGYQIYKIIDKTHIIGATYHFFISHGASKRIPLLFLKGISQEKLEHFAKEFYNKCIKIRLIQPVVEEIRQRKAEGCRMIIVSGGYDLYIKFFADEYGFDNILANQINFKNGICSGTYDDECMGTNKVSRIGTIIPLIEIDKKLSYAYTDDISDLPMLNLVDNTVVVSKRCHQLWVDGNNVRREIVYNQ